MDHTRFQILCVLLVSSLKSKKNILLCVNVSLIYFLRLLLCQFTLTELNLSDMLTYTCIQIWNNKITRHYLVINLVLLRDSMPGNFLYVPLADQLCDLQKKHLRTSRKPIQQLVHTYEYTYINIIHIHGLYNGFVNIMISLSTNIFNIVSLI